MTDLRTFEVHRLQDENGISGVGKIAEGVIFPNNQCVVFWRSKTPSLEITSSFATWHNLHIQSHNNKVEIIFHDGKPVPKIYKTRRKVANGGKI